VTSSPQGELVTCDVQQADDGMSSRPMVDTKWVIFDEGSDPEALSCNGVPRVGGQRSHNAA